MPDWRERNPADVGVTLVEVLAYVGDQLAYYQDAVGRNRRRTWARRAGGPPSVATRGSSRRRLQCQGVAGAG